MSKILVSYFSCSGNTKNAAKQISETLSADLFEIIPEESYTVDDLDWSNKKSRSSVEMNDEECRPEIKNKVYNIANYDKVIIGYPIWWYKAPRIINTFIEENDLRGKKIYIFVTSGGTSHKKSFEELKEKYNYLDFVSGKTITNSISIDEIKEWI